MHTHQTFSLHSLRRWMTMGALLGAATAAMAQTSAPAAPSELATAAVAPVTATQTPQLTIRDIYDRLDAAGYRDLREIEWSDGRYEVKARNAQGARVKLDVDGRTGEVLRSQVKR